MAISASETTDAPGAASDSAKARPEVSVLVRTFTRTDEAFRLVESIASQTLVPAEFVVVDSGSSDDVKARLREWRESGVPRARAAASNGSPAPPIPLKLIEIPNSEYQSARALNMAAEASSGGLLAIISQDARPADDLYLRNLAAAFDSDRVAGAYGRQTVNLHFSPLARKDLEKTYPPRSRVQSAPECWFVNTCSMIRRDLWERHPFDERAIISEDHEWAKWAQDRGYVVHYVSDAVVLHGHEFDRLSELWNRFYLEGKGLGYVHGRRLGPGRTTLICAREIASDAVWLARRGLVHYWPMAVVRRTVKHAAFYWGFHSAEIPRDRENGRAE